MRATKPDRKIWGEAFLGEFVVLREAVISGTHCVLVLKQCYNLDEMASSFN
jgi:hypothetical protein